jgi:MFS family permease
MKARTNAGIWNKNFTAIFIANACMYMAQQMMNSLVAKYANYLGATATVVGLVSSLFAVTALVFKVVSGPAIDSFNRRFVLAGAMTVMAVAYFGYSISGNIPMLMIARLLQGVGQAFTATCCLALAADALPKDKFGSGIGIFSMAQAAAQAIGPTVALTCMKHLGYNTTFAIGGFVMLFAAFMALQVKTEQGDKKRFRISFRNVIAPEALMPATIMLFLSMTFCVINSFLIIYAEEVKVEGIGFYFTVYACTLLFTRPMIGKLTDKYGLVKILIPAMCCFAGSFLIISIARSLSVFLLAAFIAAFGFGGCQPAIQTLCMKCVPTERRGAGSSTNYIGNDLGQLIGPIIAGHIVEGFGYSNMWRMMTIPVAIAAVVVILFRTRISRVEWEFEQKEGA